VAASLAVGWLASRAAADFYLRSVNADLKVTAQLVDAQLRDSGALADPRQMDRIMKRMGRLSGQRITVVLPGGEVASDSYENPALMDNHRSRTEIKAALAGRVATSSRYSTSMKERFIYLALPMRDDGKIIGAVRAAIPDRALNAAVRSVQSRIAAGGVFIALTAGLVSLLIARRMTRPLEQIREGAERFARGELGDKLPLPESEELAGLTDALNQMASQLKEKIRTTARQSHEQEAVLASMFEGVLAVDNEERVISLNRAAAKLLDSNEEEARGRNLQEVIRNADLRRFVSSALVCDAPIEGDVALNSGRDRVLQAHGTALRDLAGRGIGAVIVLNDVTRLRRLENLRRDFVANVSHELKTPITSIKGFVETLLDGALRSPEDAERFLRIIAKQADRLNSIIEDLLSLSKIEQGEQSSDIVLKRRGLKGPLAAVVQECELKAAERKIKVRLECSDDLKATINQPLLEQAVMNLIDNAIKYSEPGKEVLLTAGRTDAEVYIVVRDQGCGVAAEHLPRLFERFYRVDRARSRKLGGTGLGLAIVKHIVAAHGGQITVQSTPGEGSVFTIHLPPS
jgi:two-component system phosphate regulon sensor histidine kinase PhoR